ncbi:MAG: ceramidase domain-containing protein [Alphaproteobacteria bacterium]|nr:ceramidase domain-containing protein [Alphaproteobacteria bacterium]
MPVYCETALNPLATFPAEPVNTITSFVPAILGVLALVYLIRNQHKNPVAYTLAVLTILTGLGSVAWHSMRTELTLLIDWLPGAIYFLVFACFWSYYAAGRYLSVGLGLALFVLVFFIPFPVVQQYRLIILAALVLIAAGLVFATWYRRRAAFGWALGMVGAAVVAVTLRTLDLNVCDIIPVGTHFFWHIFLGIAAYAGVRVIVHLRPDPEAATDRARA